jgi:hypothetical protein
MENIQKINIDVVNHKVYEYIYTKQWDEGRVIYFTVADDTQTVNLNGCSVMFQMKKPDGYVVLYNCPIENGKAKLILSQQMSAAVGKIPYQLNIYSNNGGDESLVTTVTGYMVVEASVVQPDDVESSEEFNVITDLATELGEIADILANDGEAIIQAAQDSIEYAKRSKSYAVGGTDYDHEGQDDDYDNSKYYYNMTKDIYNTCFISKVVTLYAADWDGTDNTQVVQLQHVIADEALQLITVRPKEEYVREYHDCNVLCVHQGEGYLTFECDTIPQNDLEVFIMVQTSNTYGDVLTSNVIYLATEPDPNLHKAGDFWVQPY